MATGDVGWRVRISLHGPHRSGLLPAAEHERLEGREPRVVLAGELTEAEVALIAKAEVPAEFAHLDEELADWRP